MRFLRNANEDEMLLSFMQGELTSARFRESLLQALESCGADERLITQGDCTDPEQNTLRKKVMGPFRGYPDREIFEDMPVIREWKLAALEAEDLDRIRYINYSYWNEISNGTSLPREGAKTVLSGREIFGVSNQPLLKAAEHLTQGGSFPPVILMTGEDGYSVILEGHIRMTAFGLVPERLPGAQAYIGLTDSESLKRK